MESPSSSRKATHSSTTSAPGNQTTSAPFMPGRLKASCDFCALSKVKCDRSQPQCMRCIKNMVECHYSEARRLGRARQTYAAQTREKKESTQDRQTENSQDRSTSVTSVTSPMCSTALRDQLTSTSSLSTSSLSLPSSSVNQEPSGHAAHANPLKRTFLENDAGFLSTSFDDPFDASYCMDSPGPMDSNLHTFGLSDDFPTPKTLGQMPGFLNTGRLPGLNTPEEMDTFGLLQSLPTSADMMHWDADPMNSSPSPGPDDCMRKALQLLEGMQVTRNPCSLAHGDSRLKLHDRSPQGIDGCLHNNRITVDSMRRILGCPCARSPSVFFLLVLIVHLLIESYGGLHARYIAGTSRPTSESGHLVDPEPNTNNNSDDFLPEVRMAIGVYLPDPDTRRRLVMEALRSELKKLGPVVDSLSATYAQLGGAVTGTPRIGLGPLLASLHQVYQDALQSAREWCDGDESS